MNAADLQDRCALGQAQLVEMRYLDAEKTLAAAEQLAWDAKDFDALSRLYMPLQEARRQIRQTCMDGVIRLNHLSYSPAQQIDPAKILDVDPTGCFLLGGFASLIPAVQFRQIALDRQLFAETFLGSVFQIGDGPHAGPVAEPFVVAILPTADAPPPHFQVRSRAELLGQLPPRSLLVGVAQLYQADAAFVFALWQKLHAPFLAEADAAADPIQRMQLYRRTIQVDHACELAHQKLSDTARFLAQQR